MKEFRLIVSFLLLLSVPVIADDMDQGWSSIYGHWGQAPLYGHEIKITDDYFYIYEYASDIFPKGQVICTLPYSKSEIYKAYTPSSYKSTVHDVFVIVLSGSCKWDVQGSILVLAIPESQRKHARISALMKLEDLPRERPHIVNGPKYIPANATWSSGYGIRCRLEECGEFEQ